MQSRKEFVSEKAEHECVLEDHNHCCLCGTRLAFDHKVDYLNLKVVEDSQCECCGIKMKTREHDLH